MNKAVYSLITLRPDLSRVDILSIGVAAYVDGKWHIKVTPSLQKLKCIDKNYSENRITSIASNLHSFFKDFKSLHEARSYLDSSKSAVHLHEFEGEFICNDEFTLETQLNAIMQESVLPSSKGGKSRESTPRNRIKKSLREKFKTMGILGRKKDDINKHKVVPNFVIAEEYGLKAEFAVKNGLWRITETVDFGVGSLASKSIEAQAKCLIMQTAEKNLGKSTKKQIVVMGTNTNPESHKSLDLLNANGDLYMMESAEDMKIYFNEIQTAASN